jgi:hypothetical protein
MLSVLMALLPAAAPPLDPAAPYTAARSAPVVYDIDFRVVVTAPQGTKLLRVWVPVPQDDARQAVTPGTWSVFPADVRPAFHAEPVFGNRSRTSSSPTRRGRNSSPTPSGRPSGS